jgi:hypothetical protein
MTKQKERGFDKLSEKEKEFSNSLFIWMAQYDEEDEFMQRKVKQSSKEVEG